MSKYDDWDESYHFEDKRFSSVSYAAERFPEGLQFKSLRNKIISFLDLSFKEYEDEIIKKIIIGPKSDLGEDDVYQLLRFYGYNDFEETDVEKSKSSYK